MLHPYHYLQPDGTEQAYGSFGHVRSTTFSPLLQCRRRAEYEPIMASDVAVTRSRISFWRVADSVLCLCVFFPSMLFYWRGIWDLYGVYIYPNDSFRSNWAVFGLGCMTYLGYFLHPAVETLLRRIGNSCSRAENNDRPVQPLSDVIADGQLDTTESGNTDDRKSPVTKLHSWFSWSCVIYFVVSRLYMYIYAVAAMAYWRGVWLLTDHYLKGYNRLKGALTGLVISYTILVLTRTSRTIVFPPFVVSLDTRSDLLQPSTRFNTKIEWGSASSIAKYVADSVFSHFIITTVAIITWRSMLAMYDVLLAMILDDSVMCDVVSALIGVFLCTVTFSIEEVLAQGGARWRNGTWIQRIAFDDAMTLLKFFSESFLWRGFWNLNSEFVIKDQFLGGWVNHCIGAFMLMTLQLFSYAGSCGCSIDGMRSSRSADDITSGETHDEALFPTLYLRHYLRLPRRRQSDKLKDEACKINGNQHHEDGPFLTHQSDI